MRFVLIFCLALGFAPPVGASSKVENVGDVAAAQVNAIRARKGLPALRPDDKLVRAAETHAKDMIRKRFFSHTGSDGSTIGNRARKQGFGSCVIAENIAKGHPTLDQVLAAWMKSKGHRRNILHPEVTEFALVRGSGDIWVMMLGKPGC